MKYKNFDGIQPNPLPILINFLNMSVLSSSHQYQSISWLFSLISFILTRNLLSIWPKNKTE